MWQEFYIITVISCRNDCPFNHVFIQTSITASPLKVEGKEFAYKSSGPSVWSVPGFSSMKQLGVFLLPPGWHASPSQGYPPALNSTVPMYTPGWREALWGWSVMPRNTTQCPQSGLEPRPLTPESSTLPMRPPCSPKWRGGVLISPGGGG